MAFIVLNKILVLVYYYSYYYSLLFTLYSLLLLFFNLFLKKRTRIMNISLTFFVIILVQLYSVVVCWSAPWFFFGWFCIFRFIYFVYFVFDSLSAVALGFYFFLLKFNIQKDNCRLTRSEYLCRKKN